jgi:hypothetical protein
MQKVNQIESLQETQSADTLIDHENVGLLLKRTKHV